jgi:hypothetical protein
MARWSTREARLSSIAVSLIVSCGATTACNGSTTATCGGPSCPDEISSNGYSHNSACNSAPFVVVQNIDACPHNHTTNVGSSDGWCTERQPQHIDLSCSGLDDISNQATKVGQSGWLGVSVQVVDCGIGLGKHSL